MSGYRIYLPEYVGRELPPDPDEGAAYVGLELPQSDPTLFPLHTVNQFRGSRRHLDF